MNKLEALQKLELVKIEISSIQKLLPKESTESIAGLLAIDSVDLFSTIINELP